MNANAGNKASAAAIRAEFDRKGVSISAWAVENGLSPSVVYELLSGKKQGKRGTAHRAAVLLGLKDGEIVDADDIKGAVGDQARRAA